MATLATKRSFPGHAHIAARTDAPNEWKAIYRDRYGIDVFDPETFRGTGDEMRRRGLRAEELDALIAELAP